MAEEKKSIEISYKADIKDLKKKLGELPDITADEAKKMVSALDRQLKQAERAAKRSAEASKKAARASSKAAKQGSKDFTQLASSATIVAGAFAAMGAGIISFQQDLADLTNELTDASAKSGIAIETLAGLRLAAKGSGLEFSNLEGGLIKFQASMLDAGRGSKDLAESFSTLGVDVKDANGELRDSDSVFNDAVKALGKMENTTERNAIAMKLFGKAGGAGLIQSGALDNLEGMTELARDFGVAIDEDAIEAMGRFQRKMAEFDTVSQRTLQNLMSALTGSKDGVTAGLEMATKAMIFFGSVGKTTLDALNSNFEALFLMVKAGSMAMEKNFGGAGLMVGGAIKKMVAANAQMANIVEIATNEVDEFSKASEKSTENTRKNNEETKKGTKDKEGYAGAVREATKELDKMSAILVEVTDKQLDLTKQVEHRVDPISREVDQIKELGRLIEKEISDLEFQQYKLSEIAKTRALSVIEQEQLNSLLYAQQELEAALAENKKAELVEMTALRDKAHQDRIDQINEAKDAEIQALEIVGDRLREITSVASEVFGNIGDIAMNIAGENEEAQRRAFEVNQAAAMADVVFGTARAVAAAMILPPGARGAAIAGALAMGGTQWAKVASQPEPRYHMGGTAPDEINATLLRGEAVLSRRAVDSIGGSEGVRKIEEGSKGIAETILIQPFKHLDRYMKMQSKRKPRMIGSGGY